MRPARGMFAFVIAVIGAPVCVRAAPAELSPNAALFSAPFAAPYSDPYAARPSPILQTEAISAALAREGAAGIVRLSPADAALAPDAVAFSRLAGPSGRAADVSYARGWPSMVKLSGGGYDLDVSPHAAIGSYGGAESAEAGALVRLGAHLQDQVISGLDGLGVRAADRAAFGTPGRWYLFAAYSGRSVGLNMAGDAPGDPRRASWTADAASTLISNAQAGLGWRKGDLQASFGYVRREIRPLAADAGGAELSGSMVAFSLSLHGR
jgi:hypothetical protein